MSISEEKLAANRANAEHSTGPTTEDGKAKSCQNATTHGLTGKTVVLPHEDQNEFQRFSAEVTACLEPEGVVEREFAQIVANSQWRLRRIKSIEDGILTCGEYGNTDPESVWDTGALARAFMEHPRSFSNLSQHEHRLYRIMTNALKQIKDLQTAREKFEQDVVREANRIDFEARYTSPGFVRPAPPPLANRSDNGQALSPDAVDQRREGLVSGFVFPNNEIANETTGPEEDQNLAA